MTTRERDLAPLVSEGHVLPSKPYTKEMIHRDAEDIIRCIVENKEHCALFVVDKKYVINPRKAKSLTLGTEYVNAPKQTVEGRIKRLKNEIRVLMSEYNGFKETKYRGMLAYEKR